jgi:hypothetical protein
MTARNWAEVAATAAELPAAADGHASAVAAEP